MCVCVFSCLSMFVHKRMFIAKCVFLHVTGRKCTMCYCTALCAIVSFLQDALKTRPITRLDHFYCRDVLEEIGATIMIGDSLLATICIQTLSDAILLPRIVSCPNLKRISTVAGRITTAVLQKMERKSAIDFPFVYIRMSA